MFGLTRREHRWKAERQAAELLVAFAGTALQAAAQVSVAEAQTDAAELARLRAEAASFQMAYRMKCDEETKAQAVEIERLRGALLLMRGRLLLENPHAVTTEADALLLGPTVGIEPPRSGRLE